MLKLKLQLDNLAPFLLSILIVIQLLLLLLATITLLLLLLDYAQEKVGKEVFISDGGSCRSRSRVMVASRSRRSWMTEGTRGRSSCMRMLRRQWGKIIKL